MEYELSAKTEGKLKNKDVLTYQEYKNKLIDYFDLNDEKNLKEEKKQKEEESNNIDALMKEKESYRKGYYILLSYFNSINDEEKKKVHKELKEVGL